MLYGLKIVMMELEEQTMKWGLEHDIKHHGGYVLREAASIIASVTEPSRENYSGDEWYFKLRDKHKEDPIKRMSIASALLICAIDCAIYEEGVKQQQKAEKE